MVGPELGLDDLDDLGHGTGGTLSRHARISSASTSGKSPGLEATSWASFT